MTAQLQIDFESVRFDGPVYSPEHDQARLGAQFKHRVCTKCSVSKPYSEFYFSNGKPISACKECVLTLMKRTPEQIAADQAKQYEAYTSWVAESRNWRARNSHPDSR